MNTDANLEIVLFTLLGFLGTGILLSIILIVLHSFPRSCVGAKKPY